MPTHGRAGRGGHDIAETKVDRVTTWTLVGGVGSWLVRMHARTYDEGSLVNCSIACGTEPDGNLRKPERPPLAPQEAKYGSTTACTMSVWPTGSFVWGHRRATDLSRPRAETRPKITRLRISPLSLPSISGARANGLWIERQGSLAFWKIVQLPDLPARLCQVEGHEHGGGATPSFSFPGNCRRLPGPIPGRSVLGSLAVGRCLAEATDSVPGPVPSFFGEAARA